MKKLIILILLALPVPFLFSQNTGKIFSDNKDTVQYLKLVIKSAPAVTVEINAHYNFGVYELSANNNGDFSSAQFTNGENFGVRHGFGGTAAIKIRVHNKGNIRLCLFMSYNRFSSKYSKLLESQSDAGYANYNVYFLGAGVENNFTPSYNFKPLVGIGFLTTVINGDAKVYDKNTASYRNLKIIPAFRLGLTLYSGLEYLLTNQIGLNCGIRLVYANLWLKNTKVSDNPDEIYLNDKRVVPRIPFSGWRQFMWGELYGGFNFYFGITQKEYYIRKFRAENSVL